MTVAAGPVGPSWVRFVQPGTWKAQQSLGAILDSSPQPAPVSSWGLGPAARFGRLSRLPSLRCPTEGAPLRLAELRRLFVRQADPDAMHSPEEAAWDDDESSPCEVAS